MPVLSNSKPDGHFSSEKIGAIVFYGIHSNMNLENLHMCSQSMPTPKGEEAMGM